MLRGLCKMYTVLTAFRWVFVFQLLHAIPAHPTCVLEMIGTLESPNATIWARDLVTFGTPFAGLVAHFVAKVANGHVYCMR